MEVINFSSNPARPLGCGKMRRCFELFLLHYSIPSVQDRSSEEAGRRVVDLVAAGT